MTSNHTFRAALALHSAATAAPCTFEGWASVFNVHIDAHVPTVIEKGAFGRRLSEQRHRVKVLWQHDTNDPIGRPLELREDDRGLFIRAQLANTPRGQEAAQLLRDGIVTELSIGFDPISFYMDNSGREPVRHITDVQLWEVSLVTFGANPEARITQVHARQAAMRNSLARRIAAFERTASNFRENQLRSLRLQLLGSALQRRP